MVKPWEIDAQKSIALTKLRIKHMEKHGMGNEVIKEKNILKKQQRAKELRDAKR